MLVQAPSIARGQRIGTVCTFEGLSYCSDDNTYTTVYEELPALACSIEERTAGILTFKRVDDKGLDLFAEMFGA